MPLANHEFSPAVLQAASQRAFQGSDGEETLALVIFHRGKVVHESFGPGLSGESVLRVYSLGQLLLHIAVGSAEMRGVLNLETKLTEVFGELPPSIDASVTLRDLLQLSSGIRYPSDRESNDRLGTALPTPDFERYPVIKEFRELRGLSVFSPGERFNFGFVDRNLATYFVARAFTEEKFMHFFYDKLFPALGVRSTKIRLIHPEPSAEDFPPIDYQALSTYASAYDILKFLQLYLPDNPQAKAFFREDWPTRSWAPIPGQKTYSELRPGNQTDAFGTYWWLNRPHPGHGGKFISEAPDDLVMIRGHRGQFLALSPSAELVIVRIGNDAVTTPRVGREVTKILFLGD